MIENPLAFLSLVKTLETAVGHRTSYRHLEPFPCATIDHGMPGIIAIQNAGRIIAHHVGLTDLTFIISIVKQEDGTAGHIELRHDSPEVFIEISPEICRFKDAVLATLCHEVAHKFLHVHRIRAGSAPIEQEYLTDVATVYLGMGKIMLNGCHASVVRNTVTTGSQTITNTENMTVGYISRDCFAFVYRLICEMRKTPGHEYLAGLSAEATDAVSNCEYAFRDWHRSEYHTPEGIDALSAALRADLLEKQATAADCDYKLRALERRIGALRSQLQRSHRPFPQIEKQIAELRIPTANPHLGYLRCIEVRESVINLVRVAGHEVEIIENAPDLAKRSSDTSQGPESTAMEVVECPIDQAKLRVPAGRRRLLVTCSLCKYKFVVSTQANADEPANPRKPLPRNRGLLKPFKAIFERH